MRIRIGLAGWSNPPKMRLARGAEQSHLSYYGSCFSCVEINSSFYRPHRRATYARWRDETPAAFRFSVKMPRTITHECGLKRCTSEIAHFYEAIEALRSKLAVVLVQLPPSLKFDARSARAFFKRVPRLAGTTVVCEPRHASWFTSAADDLLRDSRVVRVAADPARCPEAALPGGSRALAYFRWHGSPHMYHSSYSTPRLGAFAAAVKQLSAKDAWCVFDNTARYAAWDNALQFAAVLKGAPLS